MEGSILEHLRLQWKERIKHSTWVLLNPLTSSSQPPIKLIENIILILQRSTWIVHDRSVQSLAPDALE